MFGNYEDKRSNFDKWLDKHDKVITRLSMVVGLVIGIIIGYINNR